MAVEIRLLQDNEIALANDFFNNVYQMNRSLENFRWEFIAGPSGKAIYIIAVDSSITSRVAIVGIQCAIPIELISSKGKTVLTAKSEDTLVDPAYRGQKIFERMYDKLFEECRKAGIQYIWGFTPAQKAFERIGFAIPFKTEQALLVFSPGKAYQYLCKLNAKNKFLDKLKILGLTLMAWASGFKRYFLPRAKHLVKAGNFAGKKSVFTRFYGDHEYYILNQTERYLTWRLRENPFHNQYTNFQIVEEGQITADVILNVRADVSYIEQMLSASDADLAPVINALIYQAEKEKSPLIRALCFNTNEILKQQGQYLTKCGFTYLKRGNYFVWKSLDDHNRIKPDQLLISRLFTQGNL